LGSNFNNFLRKFDAKNLFNIDAFKIPKYRGKKYKRVKTFRSEQKAEDFALQLEDQCESHRFLPLVVRVPIGWKFGYLYRVCIPKDMKV